MDEENTGVVGYNTAGLTLRVGETTVKQVKTMPNFNPAPNTIDVTPLDETEAVRYVPGLKDLGGALEFTANATKESIEAWNTVATTTTEQTVTISHPASGLSISFKGIASPAGLNGASVNSALETSFYITPTSAPKWSTDSGGGGGD